MWNYQQCRRLATLAVAANVMLDDVVTDFVHAGAAIEHAIDSSYSAAVPNVARVAVIRSSQIFRHGDRILQKDTIPQPTTACQPLACLGRVRTVRPD